MKIAIPVCAGHVSTVFDFAHRLLLFDIDRGTVVMCSEISFEEGSPMYRAKVLSRSEIQVLICGSISHQSVKLLSNYGIEVIPFVTGSVDDVLSAYLNDSLSDPRFLLPGTKPEMREKWKNKGQRKNEQY